MTVRIPNRYEYIKYLKTQLCTLTLCSAEKAEPRLVWLLRVGGRVGVEAGWETEVGHSYEEEEEVTII